MDISSFRDLPVCQRAIVTALRQIGGRASVRYVFARLVPRARQQSFFTREEVHRSIIQLLKSQVVWLDEEYPTWRLEKQTPAAAAKNLVAIALRPR